MSKCVELTNAEGIMVGKKYILHHGLLETLDVGQYTYLPNWGETRLIYSFSADYPADAIRRADVWYRNGLVTGGDVVSF